MYSAGPCAGNKSTEIEETVLQAVLHNALFRCMKPTSWLLPYISETQGFLASGEKLSDTNLFSRALSDFKAHGENEDYTLSQLSGGVLSHCG